MKGLKKDIKRRWELFWRQFNQRRQDIRRTSNEGDLQMFKIDSRKQERFNRIWQQDRKYNVIVNQTISRDEELTNVWENIF